ncbi:MAG: protocatechuate 3,4-dioxygenase subunit alpha [Verrucomicrobia bacterium]|nr:protocatechuate 3,4-dioxygenase subunit alpha [Verrucomicrobiota bacterium]MDA1066677.1 protocatechuate 3,4-dioxygenase subunit alpha [Verrucomicrobiota bacterium]
MSSFKQTPSQTVGPFFSYGLAPEQYGYDFRELASGNVARDYEAGEPITIVGKVFSGSGDLMKNVIVESWQADGEGKYSRTICADKFSGFGRFGTGTDEENRYIIRTVKPGKVDEQQAPHIALTIFSRGLMHHVYTRLYFSDEVEANEQDPLLRLIPANRRNTLIAQKVQDEQDVVYQFDIHMQGDQATVFLEF